MALRKLRVWIAAIAVVVGLSFQPPAKAQLGDDVGTVVAGNNRFAYDMYHKLRTSETVAAEHGNLIFSPYSISTAVGMVYTGARGQTAHEIADVFHFGLPQDRLHPAFGSLIRELNGAHRTDYELAVANRLWGQEGFPIHQPFLNTTRDHYAADLGRLDFVRDTENSRQTINHWVEDQTNNRIKNLLPQGSVTKDTALVLTNAIYFLGDWKHSFSKDATVDRPFVVSPTEQIRAPTMFQSGRFRYAEADSFQLLELPYKGDELSMLVVLPKAGGRVDDPGASVVGPSAEITPSTPLIARPTTLIRGTKTFFGLSPAVVAPTPYQSVGLNDLTPGPIGLDALTAVEAALNPEALQSAIDNLRYRDVNVYLPKFKLDTSASLKGTLSEMGMPTAFSGEADLSGIADTPLQITGVLHKAFIELDEDGTEAAAATGVVVGITSVYQPPPPVLFNADHPFHFLIRDNVTGSTLFMGRMARPEGEIAAVPEPGTIAFALVGLVCLAAAGWRRRRISQPLATC